METSAKTGTNAKEVFIKAAKMLLEDYKNFGQEEVRDSLMTGDKSSISLSQENDKENEKKKDNEDKDRRKKCC